ncbi:MAG: DUF2849 domain-containing protein [Pseudomonadota bacterium]
MPYSFQPSVIAARRRHGSQTVFLGEDDVWTPTIAEAELIDDEAHGDIRMLDAEIGATGLTDIRMVRVVEASGVAQRLAESDHAAA